MAKKFPSLIIFIFSLIFLFLFESLPFAQITLNYTPIQCVRIQDGKLWIYSDDGKYSPFFIKVGYEPAPIGRHPTDWGWAKNDPRIDNMYDDPVILNRDFEKLQRMNANTIRIWGGNNATDISGRVTDKITNAMTTSNADKTQNTLDLASKYGLKVIAGFRINGVTFDKNNNVGSTDFEGHHLRREQIINNFITFVNTFKGNRLSYFGP